MKSFVLALIIILVIGTFGFLLSKNKTNSTTIPKISSETSLLADIAVWYPSAPWSTPKETTEQTMYGSLTGKSMKATVTSPTATLPHFEQVNTLVQKGFTLDNNLSADGPGSSVWGYKKEENGETQIILFSYKTEPSSSNLNEPLQFNCPCKINTSVFVSNPFSPEQ